MRHRLFGILLLAFSSSVASAQILGDSGKVWLGVNLADLITDNDVSKLAINYNFVSNNHARLQLGYSSVSGDLQKDIDGEFNQFTGFGADTVISASPYSSCSYSVQLGYYRTVQTSNRFNIYFGIDFLFRRSMSRRELNMRVERVFSQNQKQFITTKEKAKVISQGYGVAPMFGVQFKATERINLGFEFNSQFLVTDFEESVNRNNVQTSSFDPRVFEQKESGTNGWTERTNRFNPMSGLFLYYRL